MIDVDGDLLSHSTTNVELHARCVTNELWRHVHLEVFMADRPIRGEVLAFEMRVDRHVKLGATSTDGRNEIDRRTAAALADQFGGFRGKEKLHNCSFGS